MAHQTWLTRSRSWRWVTIGLLALGAGGLAFSDLTSASGDPAAPAPAASPGAAERAQESPNKVAPAEPAPDAAALPAASAGPASLPIPAKILRYAERLVRQYDTNGDGRLQKDEWEKIHGNPPMVDADHDGVITVDEFAQYISRYGQLHRIHLFQPAADVTPPPSLFRPGGSGSAQESSTEEKAEPAPVDIANAPQMPTPAAAEDAADRVVRRAPRSARKYYISRANLPPGLPEWFTGRDADGDGQITMAEFAPSPSRSEILEFNRYDTNRDGVITARELLGLSKSKPADKDASERSAR